MCFILISKIFDKFCRCLQVGAKTLGLMAKDGVFMLIARGVFRWSNIVPRYGLSWDAFWYWESAILLSRLWVVKKKWTYSTLIPKRKKTKQKRSLTILYLLKCKVPGSNNVFLLLLLPLKKGKKVPKKGSKGVKMRPHSRNPSPSKKDQKRGTFLSSFPV